jgi:hypothetical protein
MRPATAGVVSDNIFTKHYGPWLLSNPGTSNSSLNPAPSFHFCVHAGSVVSDNTFTKRYERDSSSHRNRGPPDRSPLLLCPVFFADLTPLETAHGNSNT